MAPQCLLDKTHVTPINLENCSTGWGEWGVLSCKGATLFFPGDVEEGTLQQGKAVTPCSARPPTLALCNEITFQDSSLYLSLARGT